jgi:hypothetical protein
VLERLLAEQRLAVTRSQQRQLAPGKRHDVLDKVVHALNTATRGKRNFTGD